MTIKDLIPCYRCKYSHLSLAYADDRILHGWIYVDVEGCESGIQRYLILNNDEPAKKSCPDFKEDV